MKLLYKIVRVIALTITIIPIFMLLIMNNNFEDFIDDLFGDN